MARLGAIADLFLVHDRPVERHVDDSVGWLLGDELQLLRRARGFAPLPVPVRRGAAADPRRRRAPEERRRPRFREVRSSCRSTSATSRRPRRSAAFERVVADLLRLWEASPVAIAHDLHPDYLSTRWARRAAAGDESEGPLPPAILGGRAARAGSASSRVQHHHAHLASCLAENGVEGPALGVTWDGTGYGTDGTIWGGEFLLGDAAGFARVAHLRPFRLPGGDAAVKEPRRAALALLLELFGGGGARRDDLAPVASFSGAERALLARMVATGTRSPVTTSAGRLFDAVAALVGLHPKAGFEGQAAMALEALADPAERGAYPFPLVAGAAPAPRRLLDWGPLVLALLEDGARGVGVRDPLGPLPQRPRRRHRRRRPPRRHAARGALRRLLPEPLPPRADARAPRRGRLRGPDPPPRPAERRRHRARAGDGRRGSDGRPSRRERTAVAGPT